MSATVITGIQALLSLGFLGVIIALVSTKCALNVNCRAGSMKATRAYGTAPEDAALLMISGLSVAIYGVITFFLAYTKPASELYKRVIGYLGVPAMLFAINAILWGSYRYYWLDKLLDDISVGKKDSWFASVIGVYILGGLFIASALFTWVYTAMGNKKNGGSIVV